MAKKTGRVEQMEKLDHLIDAPPETDDGDQMLKDAHLNAAPSETAAAADLRYVTQVRVTSNGHGLTLQHGDVLVICRDPGFRRAGSRMTRCRSIPPEGWSPRPSRHCGKSPSLRSLR